MTTTEPDYDSLLRSNLERVFDERDATKRELAVGELFVAEPVLYERTSRVLGRAAISEAAGKVQAVSDTFFARPRCPGTAVLV